MCLPLHVWLTLVVLVRVLFVFHCCLLLDMCILSAIVGFFTCTDCCMSSCSFIIGGHLYVRIGVGDCAIVE